MDPTSSAIEELLNKSDVATVAFSLLFLVAMPSEFNMCFTSNARSYVRFAFRFPPFRSPLTVHVGFTGRRTWILVGLHPSEPHPDRPRRLEQIRRRRGVRSQASESRISFFTFSTRTAPRSARHDVSLIGDPLKRGDFCEVGLGSGRFLERSPLDVVDVVWCCWFCMGTCFAFW